MGHMADLLERDSERPYDQIDLELGAAEHLLIIDYRHFYYYYNITFSIALVYCFY